MGHSLGAAIGFLYAASYPNDTEMLISIDTVAPVIFEPSEIVKNLGPNLDKYVKLWSNFSILMYEWLSNH